jgi:hypothetical protein
MYVIKGYTGHNIDIIIWAILLFFNTAHIVILAG